MIGLWLLKFAPERLEKLSFLYKSYAGDPGIHISSEVQSTNLGLPELDMMVTDTSDHTLLSEWHGPQHQN